MQKIDSKILITTMLWVICACAHADGLLGLDAFFPANEAYTYNSEYGVITGFAGGVGSSTCAAIRPSGKVWEGGKLVAKYEFKEWASGCAKYVQGSGITGDGTDYGASAWTDPSRAFGVADSSSGSSNVVVLGDGGSITLTFANAVKNGTGYDFVVFENALNNVFLEFAFVEVSTDGVNFLRFPSFYLGNSAVGGDSVDGGGANDPTLAYNLGSKYMGGYGNGYDLQELVQVYQYAITHFNFETQTATDNSIFSTAYLADFLANYSLVDLDCVNYIKIVDIVGDGSTLDSKADPIYDAYPTHGTPGFDLSGVGVINQVPEPALSCLIMAFVVMFGVRIFRGRNK